MLKVSEHFFGIVVIFERQSICESPVPLITVTIRAMMLDASILVDRAPLVDEITAKLRLEAGDDSLAAKGDIDHRF